MAHLSFLIQMFPFGSFVIIVLLIAVVYSMVMAIINRNRPVCNCECCDEDDSDDDSSEDEEEDDEDDKPENGPVIMGGEEEDDV